VGEAFKLYVAAQSRAIGAVLAQEENGKGSMVAYVSHHLGDADTRYACVEKLCLSLYYAYSKFRHYLLSSTCMVACHHDLVKHLLHKPILSGRMGKWAYSLVEYDLVHESLRAMKGQVVADFIVDHMVDEAEGECLVETRDWEVFFDGSVCSRGNGVGCVIISPNGVVVELSVKLEFKCTNNQAEYEALLFGLEHLRDMGVQSVKAFGDSQLVIQQIRGESQCFDGILNEYLERCMNIIDVLESFCITYIPRAQNAKADALAQQAFGYEVSRGLFSVQEKTTSQGVHNRD
jgi:ribonuclease HI